MFCFGIITMTPQANKVIWSDCGSAGENLSFYFVKKRGLEYMPRNAMAHKNKFPFRLEGLAYSHGQFSIYEPEVGYI